MKNQRITNNIKDIVGILKNASQSFSAYSPEFLKPVISIIVYIILSIIIVILIPILLPISLFRKNEISPYDRLYRDLEEIWHKESNIIALNLLRRIYQQLTMDFNKLSKMKSVYIEPYGRFRWIEYIQVVESLYLWELQHNNFDEARELCDKLLEKIATKKSYIDRTTEKWIVYRAKIILISEGNDCAQKYLMQYFDRKKKNSPIKEYLNELKSKK